MTNLLDALGNRTGLRGTGRGPDTNKLPFSVKYLGISGACMR